MICYIICKCDIQISLLCIYKSWFANYIFNLLKVKGSIEFQKQDNWVQSSLSKDYPWLHQLKTWSNSTRICVSLVSTHSQLCFKLSLTEFWATDIIEYSSQLNLIKLNYLVFETQSNQTRVSQVQWIIKAYLKLNLESFSQIWILIKFWLTSYSNFNNKLLSQNMIYKHIVFKSI